MSSSRCSDQPCYLEPESHPAQELLSWGPNNRTTGQPFLSLRPLATSTVGLEVCALSVRCGNLRAWKSACAVPAWRCRGLRRRRAKVGSTRDQRGSFDLIGKMAGIPFDYASLGFFKCLRNGRLFRVLEPNSQQTVATSSAL